jgi:hypothetical protein
MDLTYALTAFALLLGVLAFGVRLHCHHPITKAPIRGCILPVYGFFGRCRTRSHSRRAGAVYRVIAVLGGKRLAARRTCPSCGGSAIFQRYLGDGNPYLGCSNYPKCKTPRNLAAFR